MLKTERLNLILTEEEMRRLEELAAANAGSNKSLMVRNLINLAWKNPRGLKLHDPKGKELEKE